MRLRCLFGPVELEANRFLADARQSGNCRIWGWNDGVDSRLQPGQGWVDLLGSCPDGWMPDCLIWWMPAGSWSPHSWSVPVPIIGIASEWGLNWHRYRAEGPSCELIFSESVGAERLRRCGLRHVRQCSLAGVGNDVLSDRDLNAARDIDVFVAGDLSQLNQCARRPSSLRLARLSDRYHIVAQAVDSSKEYLDLVRRSRIVVHFSHFADGSARAFQAAAMGALLVDVDRDGEIQRYLTDRTECVVLGESNLDDLLEYYLGHEDARRQIAEAGSRRARSVSFKASWNQMIAELESEWPVILERVQKRGESSKRSELIAQSFSVRAHDTGGLITEIGAEVVSSPLDAALHHALGIATLVSNPESGLRGAAASFQRAFECDLYHIVAGLSLVECLVASDRKQDAIETARKLLRALDSPAPLHPEVLNAVPVSNGNTVYRQAWERAGWENAGDREAEQSAKRALVRGRVHSLLGELTGDLVHFHEAVIANGQQPHLRAALGCALARAGRLADAVSHLRTAVEMNPLDQRACRALLQLFGDLGDPTSQRQFASDLRRVAKTSPEYWQDTSWFANIPPSGQELASVLIVCCDGFGVTRQCLDSVFRNTRAPFELVVVDNGSVDGTSEFLSELQANPNGAARVHVIRNAENRGYPIAMNQALAEARGDYIVMLNNDTVVPSGWLDGLIRWAFHEWPKVGLVGPVTNYAPPPQCVRVPYSDPASGLESYAAQHRYRHAGRGIEVPRLSGFCMLLRRDVLKRVGKLDEQFGIGFFDDDDFVLRVCDAGYRVLIAEDVFVHHFGSKTFQALGIDCERQLATNLDLFRKKWGDERAARYRLPPRKDVTAVESSADCAGLLPIRRTTGVSLCVIARNEEDNIRECLRGWSELFCEAVVVDTGSTDQTRTLAQELGARVVEFPWCDSFAAARNVSIEHATGEWIFWLDADDRLDDANRGKLRKLFEGLGSQNAAYSMKCACISEKPGGPVTVVDHVRLFRNDPRIRWKYRVHEQILMAVRATGGEIRWADVTIHHVGYQNPALRRRKLERDLRLLNLEQAEKPDDPFTLFNLGAVYLELARPAESLPYLRQSIERSHSGDSIVRKLYAMVTTAYRQLAQGAEALEACREGRRLYPDDAELLFTEGLLHREANRPADAEACWVRLLNSNEGEHFASVDSGMRGHKARHNLAVLYVDQQRYAEAEAQWHAALTSEPNFLPAWVGLGEIYLRRKQYVELEELISRLDGDSSRSTPVEATILRARAYLDRKEFAAARWSISEAIEQYPNELMPRVVLSHIVMKEGSDPAAIEKALRDVLAIDPEHREATRNLEVLRAQQRMYA